MAFPATTNSSPRSPVKVFFRAVFGLLFAPIDAAIGFFKGLFYFCKSPTDYFWSDLSVGNKVGDHKGRKLSALMGFSRALAIAAATICLLGFLGTLILPIPGVAPLYALTVLGILKAIGITTAWAIAARSVGTLIGGVIDFFKLNKLAIKPAVEPSIKTAPAPLEKQSSEENLFTTSRLMKGCIGNAVFTGLCGEAGPATYVMLQPKQSAVQQDSPPASAAPVISGGPQSATNSDSEPPTPPSNSSTPPATPPGAGPRSISDNAS